MKTLLLNNNMQPLAFICEKKAIRLLYKEKVDIISVWNNIRYFHSNGFIDLPATLKLKYNINRQAVKMLFSRNAIFKRDRYSCSYCGVFLSPNQITLDHIIPKSRGGTSSFDNCVAACLDCNKRKADRLLEEVNMKLLNKPKTPEGYLFIPSEKEKWHSSWKFFVGMY